MLYIKRALASTLGQKYLTAITGIGLVIFVIFHFISNLMLFHPNPAIYNGLSNSLIELGSWLVLAEIGLLAIVVIHIVVAIRLKYLAMRARPVAYVHKQSKQGPSKEGFSSTRLLLSGVVILGFLIIHIAQFKFGPNISEGYSTVIQGKTVRDLHRIVAETFKKSYWASFYFVCMILLGFHLRHGIWSLFQSLGATNRRTTGPIYRIGTTLAVLVALGFALMPIWFFIGLGGSGK